ncbi:hypothetical protein Btru_022219 [Bulinus truncatus]|nr:hypothetical protein Btru_022219 [Bulinus truncatus]
MFNSLVELTCGLFSGISTIFCSTLCSSECGSAIYSFKYKTCITFVEKFYNSSIAWIQDPDWLVLYRDEPIKHGDWTMVFRAQKAINLSLYDVWTATGRHDDSPLSSGFLNGCYRLDNLGGCKQHFRSSILDNWNNITQVKILYVNGSEANYIVFNGASTTNHSWFQQSNIFTSSWYSRRPNKSVFLVYGEFLGCSDDCHYVIAVDQATDGCMTQCSDGVTQLMYPHQTASDGVTQLMYPHQTTSDGVTQLMYPHQTTSDEVTQLMYPHQTTSDEVTQLMYSHQTTSDGVTQLMYPHQTTSDEVTQLMYPHQTTSDEVTQLMYPHETTSDGVTQLMYPHQTTSDEVTQLMYPHQTTSDGVTQLMYPHQTTSDEVTQLMYPHQTTSDGVTQLMYQHQTTSDEVTQLMYPHQTTSDGVTHQCLNSEPKIWESFGWWNQLFTHYSKSQHCVTSFFVSVP